MKKKKKREKAASPEFSPCCTVKETKSSVRKYAINYSMTSERHLYCCLVNSDCFFVFFVFLLWMWHYCLRVETEWLLFLTAALAAGVSVFQGDKGCIICGLMSKDVRHCLSFCARAALGDFPSSAVAQTPFAKAHTARQFLGFFFSLSGNQFPSQSARHVP